MLFRVRHHPFHCGAQATFVSYSSYRIPSPFYLIVTECALLYTTWVASFGEDIPEALNIGIFNPHPVPVRYVEMRKRPGTHRMRTTAGTIKDPNDFELCTSYNARFS